MNGESPRVHMRKSPALAGWLSVLPGVGQVYVGYYLQGFVHILIFGSCIWLTDHAEGLEPVVGPFIAFFWIFNIIDAVRKAKLYNMHMLGDREGSLPTDSPLIGGVILLVIGVLALLHQTLGMDMEWVEDVWPLGLIAIGGYLVWKYKRQRSELRNGPPATPWAPPPAPSTRLDAAPYPTAPPASGADSDASASQV